MSLIFFTFISNHEEALQSAFPLLMLLTARFVQAWAWCFYSPGVMRKVLPSKNSRLLERQFGEARQRYETKAVGSRRHIDNALTLHKQIWTRRKILTDTLNVLNKIYSYFVTDA